MEFSSKTDHSKSVFCLYFGEREVVFGGANP